MTPEQVQLLTVAGSAVSGAIALLGGHAGVQAGLRWWAGYRERRARAREEREARDGERGDRLVARLESQERRIEAVEEHARECAQALGETQSALTASEIARAQDKADCVERIMKLEHEVRDARADITGRIELAAERVVRSTRPAIPPPARLGAIGVPVRSSRDDMEPDGE